MSTQTDSRLAELATELLGAKLAAEFVREAWAAASPDAKRKIADALVERVATRIKDGDYALDRHIEELVRGHLDGALGDQEERIRKAVADRADAWTEKQIQETISRVTERIMSYMSSRIAREIQDNFSKFR